MYAATNIAEPSWSETATCTPEVRPACSAIRGKTPGLGSTHTPDQPSCFSKYHVLE